MDTMKHFRMHSKVKVVGSWRLRCGKQAILYNVPQDYMICLRRDKGFSEGRRRTFLIF